MKGPQTSNVVAFALLASLAPLLAVGGRPEVHRALRSRRAGREAGVLAPATRPPAPALQPAATQYYGLVQLGKPAQEFRVVFDTASGQLVLPSSKCPDAACVSHRRFFSENSSSAAQIGWADEPTKAITGDDRDTKTLSLIGSDVSGEFVRDTLCLGGGLCGVADFVTLTEEPEAAFNGLAFDGVLGLAPSSPDADEFNVARALLGNLSAERSVFGFYLSQPTSSSPGGGEVAFGGYDRSLMETEPHWAPVSVNGSWQFLVDDVAVGGKAMGLCDKAGCQASLDTGASLIMAPGNLLWEMVQKLGIDDTCGHATAALGFVVGGKVLELDQSDYVERDGEGCRLLMASLTSVEKGHPALVLGYPFLRKYYTIFDLAHNRVGLARARHGQRGARPARDGLTRVPLVGLRP